MKKVLITMALLLLFAQTADAQWNKGYIDHKVSIVDLNGRSVTDISQVYIYLPGTTTNQTIYADRGLANAITLPMTTTSDNTTLDQTTGRITWWGQDSYDFLLGNDDVTVNNAYTNSMTSNQGQIVFPYFLRTYDSQSLLDSQSITYGTDLDWVSNGGTTGDLMTWTPKANGAIFRIGNAGGTTCSDFQVYTASGVGFLIDEGADTLGITGLTANINASSNYATNINTGTSTGAVNIGSSTSGAVGVDTTSTVIINADDSVDVTTTGAAADIDIDAAIGSVIIDGGEAAADAVSIVAGAGGVDISSAATFDIDLTATGGKILGIASEAVADQFKIDATGTVAGDAINLETTDGGVMVNADGAANGDIELNAADDVIITAGAAITITNVEAVTVSGALTVAGATGLASSTIADQVITDAASVTLTAAMSGKILTIANLAQNTTIDLPVEADGLNFEFWYVGGSVETHDHIIDAEANANFYIGGLQFIDSDDNSISSVYSNGSTNSKLTLSNLEAGTSIKITCDGTNWYITGTVYSDTAPVFAASI